MRKERHPRKWTYRWGGTHQKMTVGIFFLLLHSSFLPFLNNVRNHLGDSGTLEQLQPISEERFPFLKPLFYRQGMRGWRPRSRRRKPKSRSSKKTFQTSKPRQIRGEAPPPSQPLHRLTLFFAPHSGIIRFRAKASSSWWLKRFPFFLFSFFFFFFFVTVSLNVSCYSH